MAIRPGAGAGWPPTPPTNDESAAFEGLSSDLQSVLREFKVAYKTWARIAESGFTELAEWSDRWPDKATCMERAPLRTDSAKMTMGGTKL